MNPSRASGVKPVRGEPVESCKLRYFNSFEFLDHRRLAEEKSPLIEEPHDAVDVLAALIVPETVCL